MSNPNDFNTHTSSKSTCWDGDMRKTYKFYSERKGFLENTTFVVFGYNKCSVSNPNDFNTHTSSKSTCWDVDMRKTYKFYSELKILLKNLHYLSFLAITTAVCQVQMIFTLIRLQNEYDGMRKTQKFYSERKGFLENTTFGRFWL